MLQHCNTLILYLYYYIKPPRSYTPYQPYRPYNIGVSIFTRIMLVVPYYDYSIMGPKTLF